jgi:protocatechuate 3,4-dioxygenase beta subunit
MAATMRKNLILAGGIAGLLILVVAVFDPFGIFGGAETPVADTIEINAESDQDASPAIEPELETTKRVVAMESAEEQAKDVVFFARTTEGVQRFEAGRGWARIPLNAEATTPVVALSLSRWSAVVELPAVHAEAEASGEVLLNLDTQAADLELTVSVAGQDEPALPKAVIHPLGEQVIASAAELYLEDLSAGTFLFHSSLGKLSWVDLPPAGYEIEITHKDCVTQKLQVHLNAGQALQMPVELQPSGGISGEVANAVGEKLAGAEVALWQKPSSNALEDPLLAFRTYGFFPRSEMGLRTTTAEDGSFRFENLAPGDWTVLVHASGYRPLISSDVIEAVSAETAKTGTLTPVPGFNLTLNLVGVNGQGVSSASVRWMKKPPSGRALPQQASSLPIASDANGQCLLAGLPNGRIHLQVVHDDFAVAEQAIDIQVDPATPELLEITLHEGRKLNGRVLDIVSEQPVAGVDLKILPRMGGARSLAGFGPGFTTEAITDEDGAFSFSSLPPDDYLLIANHADYAQTLSPPISVAEGVSNETQLYISPGANLSVELLDTTGAPLPNTWVIALGEVNQDFRRQQTDELGVARFEHMPAGTYKVMQADSVAQATGKSGRLHRDYEYCSLMDLENREVLLGGREIFSTLEGFVLLGGKAVSGRRVVLLADDGTRIATSDKSGFYQFEDLVPGNYLFQVTTGASTLGGSFFGSVGVTSDAITNRDIILPSAQLEIHVLDARGGRPVPRIPINLRPADGTAIAGGQFQSSDDNGVATFKTLRPGKYLVCTGEAAMPFFGGTGMFGAKMLEVEIEPGQKSTQRLDVRLPRSATFTANVRDPQGRPLDNVHLHYENTKGQVLNRMSMTGSNANGFIELRGLPPGKGVIVARHPSFGLSRTPIELVEGQRASRTITLQTASLLYVQMVDSDGRPLTGVIATVVQTDGRVIGRLSTMEEAQETRLAYLRGIEQKLGPLLPGSYSVKMFRPGEKPRFHPVEVLPNSRDQHLRLVY